MQGRHSTIVHEGPVFRVETFQYQDPCGSQVRKDVVRHPGAVTVIPVLDSGQLVMIRNQRIAVSNTLLEFCAGSLEPGEPPIQAAHRELREECGYRAQQMRSVGWFFTSPGFCDERMHVFEARGLEACGQKLEPGEMIEVVEKSLAEIQDAIAGGELVDGKTITACTLWRLEKGISLFEGDA